MTASKPVLFVELIDKQNAEVDFRITEEGRQVMESISNKLVEEGNPLDISDHHCRSTKDWEELPRQ